MFDSRLFIRALGVVVVLGAAGAAGLVATPRSAQAEAPKDRIVVAVTGLRNSSGSVRCSLYDDPEGFPTEQKHVVAKTRAVPSSASATCTFSAPAKGKSYAVVIHHDENDDGKFQRNAIGLPLEGYGFSNNVRPVLSPPSFAACQFSFKGGETSLGITARY